MGHFYLSKNDQAGARYPRLTTCWQNSANNYCCNFGRGPRASSADIEDLADIRDLAPVAFVDGRRPTWSLGPAARRGAVLERRRKTGRQSTAGDAHLLSICGEGSQFSDCFPQNYCLLLRQRQAFQKTFPEENTTYVSPSISPKRTVCGSYEN